MSRAGEESRERELPDVRRAAPVPVLEDRMRIETTYKFDKVTWTGHQYGPCQGCNKTTRRQKTFIQTVSPFNRNKDTKRPKTYNEIQKEVRAQAIAWGAQRPWCTKCEGSEAWQKWMADQT